MKSFDQNEETKRKIQRINQLYSKLKTADNAQYLEEFTVLIKEAAPTAASVPNRKFGSKLIETFYRYLLEKLKMKEGVCYDYSKRIERICKELGINPEDFATGKEDIDKLIAMYTLGGPKYDENRRKHNAPSAALKKFKDFLEKATYPCGSPVAEWRIPWLLEEEPEPDSDDIPYMIDPDDSCDVVDVDERNCNRNYNNNLPDDCYAQARIFLRETEGDMPFEIKVKHCSEIKISNYECTITYEENGNICATEHKVINAKNYADLIRLMRKYHIILNMDRTPATVAVPFGGAHTYEYEFEGKSNYSRSHKLFDSKNRNLVARAYDEYNQIIANIINQ